MCTGPYSFVRHEWRICFLVFCDIYSSFFSRLTHSSTSSNSVSLSNSPSFSFFSMTFFLDRLCQIFLLRTKLSTFRIYLNNWEQSPYFKILNLPSRNPFFAMWDNIYKLHGFWYLFNLPQLLRHTIIYNRTPYECFALSSL